MKGLKNSVKICLLAVMCSAMLFGCAKKTVADTKSTATPTVPQITARDNLAEENIEQVQREKHENTDRRDGDMRIGRIISGTRRRFDFGIEGNYSVEYIRAPQGTERDETLDYNLTLEKDNTFTLTVVSNGITAEHNGHWYARRGEIMMFYDEPQDATAHNVYVSDSLFGELLPKHKIMIYDNCHTVILARSQDNSDPSLNK